MSKRLFLAALVLALMLPHGAAHALKFVADVSFTASGFPTGAPDDPVNGSFAFQYDDSAITGSGLEEITDIPLTSLSLSFGGSAFPLNDAAAEVNFFNGNAFSFVVFGLLNGSTVSSISTTRDFLFITNFNSLPPSPNSFTYVVPGNSTLFSTDTVTVTNFDLKVPEPASLALVAVGLAGMGLVRRRRSRP